MKMFIRSEKIHFVGIGGVGMSGIAELLLRLGFRVSGSDISESPVLKRLRHNGAEIHVGHRASNIRDQDVVVVSSAIDASNPEIREAQKRRIPVIPRAEMLAELMRLKKGIAVAGTHGKTTTTSMLGNILQTAGLDPTTIVGGKFLNIGGNARYGRGEYLVCEADESDGSFLRLTPIVNIVTNIDNDHMDFYKTWENLRGAFRMFINLVPFYGFSVVCGDDANVRRVLKESTKIYYTYGFGEKNDYRATEVEATDDGMSFDIGFGSKKLGRFHVPRFGKHAVLNAMAAAIVAFNLKVPSTEIRKGLAAFLGVGRRMEFLGEAEGIRVFDDYGHHPTEIRNTIDAFRLIPAKRRIGLFQPHRYSRTKLLAKEFGPAFQGLDMLVVTDVYAASEEPIRGISGRTIADRVTGVKKVLYVQDKKEIPQAVVPLLEEGDMVITFGAGDIYKTGHSLLELLKKRR